MAHTSRPVPAARAALVAVGLSALAAGCGAPAPARTSATSILAHPAVPFDGVPQVGALFAGSLSAIHFCTAAVVDSPSRDLVVTAAHCVAGAGTSLLFAPMYHDGVLPYGAWQVRAAYDDPGWAATQDPGRDVAVLALAPQTGGGRSVDVEDLTGGYRVGGTPPPGTAVTVIGYPLGTTGRPVRCTAEVTDTSGYPTFGCDGFVAGTSGGPWVEARSGVSGPARIDGLVGGLHQGGCTPSVSYSAPFGPWVVELLARAAAGGPGEILPVAGGDGC